MAGFKECAPVPQSLDVSFTFEAVIGGLDGFGSKFQLFCKLNDTRKAFVDLPTS